MSKPPIQLTHEEIGSSFFYAGIDLSFYTNRKFEEGDQVIFDGKTYTVFLWESVEDEKPSWLNTYDLPNHAVASPSD